MNRETGRYVRLGIREYGWLISLDGQLHQREIAAFLGQENAFAEEFLRRLEAAKLILFSEVPVRLAAASQETAPVAAARLFEWTQFGQMRIRVTGASRIVDRLAEMRVLRSKAFLAITIWLGLLGIAVGIRLLQAAGSSWQTFALSGAQIVFLVFLVFATAAFHELGHAVVSTAFGAPVKSMGLMLYYFQPAAFADITNAWLLKNKWHRVAISAAGVYVQAVANAITVAVLFGLRSLGRPSPLLLDFVAINLSMIVFNLIPFVKLDGYWMLSAALSIPNLRDRALEWWRAWVTSKVTRRPINGASLRYNAVLLMAPMSRSLLACFGASATVFGVSMWAGGLSFLFRIGRWVGLRTTGSYLFVGGLLILGAILFLVRWRRASRRPAPSQAVPAPSPVPAINYQIDHERSVRLNPYATVVNQDATTMVFAWTSADQLTVPSSPHLVDVLPKLRKGISMHELEKNGERVDPHVANVLQRLWHLKHLRYSSDWTFQEGEQRYARQLGWLSLNAAVRGSESAVLSNLKTKSVTILGVGGVGSNVAVNLAACGVGELHLVDGDSIELSNLNRQLLYTPSDVGKPKVEIAAARLAQFDPSLRIRTTQLFVRSVQDVMEVIQGSDFVVRALDTPVEAQMWINEACVRMGIPCTGAGFTAQGAIVGPTVIPGVTACLACNRAELPWLDRGLGGTFAPVVTVTSGILANEIVACLVGLGQPRTARGILVIDAPTFDVHLQEFSRDENCSLCGQRKRAMA